MISEVFHANHLFTKNDLINFHSNFPVKISFTRQSLCSSNNANLDALYCQTRSKYLFLLNEKQEPVRGMYLAFITGHMGQGCVLSW